MVDAGPISLLKETFPEPSVDFEPRLLVNPVVYTNDTLTVVPGMPFFVFVSYASTFTVWIFPRTMGLCLTLIESHSSDLLLLAGGSLPITLSFIVVVSVVVSESASEERICNLVS